MRHTLLLSIGLLTILGAAPFAFTEDPVGTAFTYQGRLTDGGSPANGAYDFEFRLYDALVGGGQVGSIVSVDDQLVGNGLFTVSLDFGSGSFTGAARWLETAVRPGDSNDPEGFVTLSPRQPITPSPYALYAVFAPSATTTKAGSGSVAVNLAAASSQSVAAIGFGHTFATVPAVMITGMTGSGAPAMLVPQAANVTTTGFDLVLANPSAVQVTGEYSFNWIATAVAGTQQTWYRDQDGDGYSDGTSQTREGDAPTGYYLASALTATSGDCDDGNAAVHPGVSELCDELDNDCDGLVDVRSAPHCDWDVGVCEPTHREKCWAGTWVCDYGPHYEPEETTCDGLDNDCDGVTDEGLVGEPCALQEGVCAGSTTVCDDRGGVTCQYPPEYEEDEVTCDELDNDCDGLVDLRSAPHCDRDDGVCEPTYREKCWAGTWVCDYGPHYEPEEESCDNLDNDCDGQTDEGC